MELTLYPSSGWRRIVRPASPSAWTVVGITAAYLLTELADMPAPPPPNEAGGCWKELPETLAKKKAIWNPQNEDHRCFMWCVLAHCLGLEGLTWQRKRTVSCSGSFFNQTAGTVDVYGLQILDATLEAGKEEEDTAALALLLKHEFLDGGAAGHPGRGAAGAHAHHARKFSGVLQQPELRGLGQLWWEASAGGLPRKKIPVLPWGDDCSTLFLPMAARPQLPGIEARPRRRQAAEHPLSPGSLLYVLYVLYLTRQAAEHPLSPGSLLYVLYVLYLTRQAAEHPLSPVGAPYAPHFAWFLHEHVFCTVLHGFCMTCGFTPCPSPLFFSCQAAVRRFILENLAVGRQGGAERALVTKCAKRAPR